MTSSIRKIQCSASERPDFLQRHAGRHFVDYEQLVCAAMKRCCSEYSGGFWNFFSLTNGGFFMSLDVECDFTMETQENHANGRMSAEAASIGVNILVQNRMAWKTGAEQFTRAYERLRDFAVKHPEKSEIMSFIQNSSPVLTNDSVILLSGIRKSPKPCHLSAEGRNEEADHLTPCIYVACLASYNSGIMHGIWVDADQGTLHIREKVAGMLQSSPVSGSEEWAIHDYEGFEGFDLSESEGFEQVSKKAAFLSEHGRTGTLIAEYYDGDLSEAREAMESRYFGSWETIGEFAQHLVMETGEADRVPDYLASYINFPVLGRDLSCCGDWIFLDDRNVIHVFSEN